MKFKDGKTLSAYVRSKLHSGYITILCRQMLSLLEGKKTANNIGVTFLGKMVFHLAIDRCFSVEISGRNEENLGFW